MGLSDILHYEFVQRANCSGHADRCRFFHTGSFSCPAPFFSDWRRACPYYLWQCCHRNADRRQPCLHYIGRPALSDAFISGYSQIDSFPAYHGDAAIGIVSSVGIATGIILASLSGGYNLDLFSYLFGNILTVTQTELWLSFIVFLTVVATVIIFYHDLFAITFDEELAQTMGVKTKRNQCNSLSADGGSRGFSDESCRHYARFRNADFAAADCSAAIRQL